jgi:hypothetical protein
VPGARSPGSAQQPVEADGCTRLGGSQFAKRVGVFSADDKISQPFSETFGGGFAKQASCEVRA